MTEPDEFVTYDAAYVLGALSPEDRSAFEEHLRTCDRCSRAVAELAGLPGLLSQVTADMLGPAPDAPTGFSDAGSPGAVRPGTGKPGVKPSRAVEPPPEWPWPVASLPDGVLPGPGRRPAGTAGRESPPGGRTAEPRPDRELPPGTPGTVLGEPSPAGSPRGMAPGEPVPEVWQPGVAPDEPSLGGVSSGAPQRVTAPGERSPGGEPRSATAPPSSRGARGPGMVPGEPPPEEMLPALLRTVHRGRRRRLAATIAAAVAAAAAVLAAIFVSLSAGDGGGTAMTPLGAYPVQATAAVASVSGGSRVDMSCTYRGARQGAGYRLVALRADGSATELATWTATPDRDARISVGTDVPREQITALEVRTTSGVPLLRWYP
ncbi:hypothetical protein FHX46_002469 [Amycolatopsis viridis]|uniref:Putative zinc-finger domain-containing protein n=1 Tax=Amycolatopsis viridis TaxID=185678 RepID=A0ABX0SSJ2_9PSEU|nr:hypothetical protein [Amycolatopsis viridis]